MLVRNRCVPTRLVALTAFAALTAFVSLAGPSAATTVRGSTFRVGTDAACDFTTLEQALQAAKINDFVKRNQDLILLSNNQTYAGEYAILNQSVLIEGGYADCSSSARGDATQVLPSAGQRVFTVDGSDGLVHHVELENLRIDNIYTGYVGPSDGGLVHAIGANLELRLRGTSLLGGKADDGGALYAASGASVVAAGVTFAANDASNGGAVYLELGADLVARGSSFAGNYSDVSAVIEARDASSVHLEASTLHLNTGASMIRTFDTATFYGVGLSVGNNNRERNKTDGRDTTWVLHEDLGSGIHRVADSILYDTDGRLAPVGVSTATHTWHCVLIDDAAKDPGIVSVLVADPLWRDGANGDFRLQPSSPAIDACDSVDAAGTFDALGAPRGVDDPSTPDSGGPYDLGAFEHTAIFGDGFESGGLTAWSGSVL